ncbi:MAG: hypothetical protein R8J94_21730 [Acidimicrobiia bacterium]|nr:hypothetical protein [Acidimicrobiia bacterium]
MAEPLKFPKSLVTCNDDVLRISELVVVDRDVVAHVQNATDPADAVVECLALGARAIRAAQAGIDETTVTASFDSMTTTFRANVDAAVAEINSAAMSLLDPENGSMTQALDAQKRELVQLLEIATDPDSARSIASQISPHLDRMGRDQMERLRALVSLDSDGSPLRALGQGLEKRLAGELRSMREEINRIAESVSVKEAVAEVIELSPAKGVAFEDTIHEVLLTLAAPHGDLPEQTGTDVGSAGSKKGDEVITLNPADVGGSTVRFVLEAKARKLGLRNILDELDQALDNRDASAAIAVFRGQDLAPTSVPFHTFGNKAIAVLDKDCEDDAALRVAYMWARWVAQRDCTAPQQTEIDAEQVCVAIDDAVRALEAERTIKRSHTQARNAIDTAAEHVATLRREVESALDRASRAMRGGE